MIDFIYKEFNDGILYRGNCIEILQLLPDQSIQCCITSPPYWRLRDYGDNMQIGSEQTMEEYIEKMVRVFREVRRILRNDGTLWLNLGDIYASNKTGNTNGTYGRVKQKMGINDTEIKRHVPNGLKLKDLVGMPWRVAFALQSDDWYLRQDIIWHKSNPMPESVTDRCTKSHEYIFLMTKSPKYYYDANSIREPAVTKDTIIRNRNLSKLNNTPGRTKMGGLKTNDYKYRNKRSVWSITNKPYRGAHFAVYPPDLIIPCIKAGSKIGDVILDPFGGSGTTAMMAKKYNRKFIHIDLSYHEIAEQRIKNVERNLFVK